MSSRIEQGGVGDSAFHLAQVNIAYVYGSRHAAVMRRRREWFQRFESVYVALWWIPSGHHPSVTEAIERLADLEAHGTTPAPPPDPRMRWSTA